MKTLWVIVGSVALSLVMFGTGLVAATAFFSAEPERHAAMNMDTTGLWTSKAVRVNTAAQELVRLPDRPLSDAARELATKPAEPVDDVVTGSTKAEPQMVDSKANAAHLDWCSSRYRSYNPDDNTYRPFSGGKRPCISPYQVDGATQRVRSSGNGDPSGGTADLLSYVVEEARPTSAHAASCFERYQSYRPSDNTYQPYGGGARQECR